MTGIQISDLTANNPPPNKRRRKKKIPNLAELSQEYKNLTIKQTGSKVVANYQQTGSKVVAQTVANYQQTGSKVVAESKVNNQQTGSKVVAQPVAEVVAKYQQTDSKVVAKNTFFALSGIQKELLEVLYSSCRNMGQKVTQKLSIQYLKEQVNKDTGTTKNAVHRLIKKHLISKYQFKNGRGGWTQYRLTDSVYSELLQNETGSKVVANYQQTGSKVVAQPVAEVVASPPSSISSILNNINTNTTSSLTSDEGTQLSPEWSNIQTPEILKELGFGKKHISDMKRNFKFSALDIQELLDLYAYDLGQGELDKLKSRNINPVRYFFGCLKKGGYNSVHGGFKSPEEQAQEDQMALLEKRKKEKEKNRKNLEALAFNEWIEKTPDEEIKKLVSPGRLAFMGFVHKPMVQGYFIKNEMEKFLEELQ